MYLEPMEGGPKPIGAKCDDYSTALENIKFGTSAQLLY
jgi:hypothetical protein